MKPRTLDLFSGCGGSSYGAVKAGARIVAAVDAWDLAAQTYKANFADAHVVTTRLESLRPSTLKRKIGTIDLLLASPECTNHTPAKGNAKRSELSRETALQVKRYAEVFKPRWLVIENVIQMRDWRRYKSFIKSLKDLGYNIREQVLDAQDFGVPQRRRRLFILADRKGLPRKVMPSKGRRPSAHQVINEKGGWAFSPLFSEGRADNTIVRYLTGLSHVGPEKSFLIVYYGSDGAGGWQPLSKPLRTITTVDRFALVRQTNGEPVFRMLQVPELQGAMGFGSDFTFVSGTRRDRIKMLGNAVCPAVMTQVVSSLMRGPEPTAHPKGR